MTAPFGAPASDCPWCISTHIADVDCTCQQPCAVGWCPAQEAPCTA